VGAITATCTSCRQATIAAIQATIVLPLPTSPCSSRCIGCGFPRSFRISLTTRLWPRQVERKPSLDLVDDLAVPRKRNRLLPLRPRPPESQRPLEGEQFAEDQSPLLGEEKSRKRSTSASSRGKWMAASDSWRGGIPTRARMPGGKYSISWEACRWTTSHWILRRTRGGIPSTSG